MQTYSQRYDDRNDAMDLLSVLGTYDSLSDPHLTRYFKKPRIRQHLQRTGLVSSPPLCVQARKLHSQSTRTLERVHTRSENQSEMHLVLL